MDTFQALTAYGPMGVMLVALGSFFWIAAKWLARLVEDKVWPDIKAWMTSHEATLKEILAALKKSNSGNEQLGREVFSLREQVMTLRAELARLKCAESPNAIAMHEARVARGDHDHADPTGPAPQVQPMRGPMPLPGFNDCGQSGEELSRIKAAKAKIWVEKAKEKPATEYDCADCTNE